MVRIYIIVFVFFFLTNCQEGKKTESEVIPYNRILSKEIRETLPHLIELRNSTIEDRSSFQNGDLFSNFLVTENHIYLHTTMMDCVNRSFYEFTEKIEEENFTIWVDAESVQPERFFDLKNLKLVERSDEYMICKDWYWLKAKYKRIGTELKLEKISTILDNNYSATSFYDKQDSAFLHKVEVLMVEPEPEPTLPNENMK
ncbi:hypothetical protein [Moheibacter stercoris]|uniref:Uncharacterized protein n=1 Tax=Moheibacter stercoris TaxID=1628251 RepID=A0ABV2LSE1_9FLAO